MDAKQYLQFLKDCSFESESELALMREHQMQYGRIRAEQFNDPEMVGRYEAFSQKDASLAQTEFINEQILSYIKGSLPADLQLKLDKIPVGVLPIRSVNACAALSPDGDPLIIIDSGLLSMAHFYQESKAVLSVIAKNQGIEVATKYITQVYKFIAQYYDQSGELGFPEPTTEIEIPSDHILMATSAAIAMEAFVIAHELGHVYAGHLDPSSTKSVCMYPQQESPTEIYQHSWEQEYEADSLGWEWYQQAWQSIPGVRGFGKEVGSSVPLYLFELIALVEANVPAFSRYSTHPPAAYRLAKLINKIQADGDSYALEIAVKLLQIVMTFPKVV